MVQVCAAPFALFTVMHQPWKHTQREENTPFLHLIQKTPLNYVLKQTHTMNPATLKCIP